MSDYLHSSASIVEINFENSSASQPAYRYEVEYTTLEVWKAEFEGLLVLLHDGDDDMAVDVAVGQLDEFEKVCPCPALSIAS